MAASSSSGGTVRVDRVYAHPPQKVWRALTESALIARWLMENDFQAEVGRRFTFRTEPGPGFDGVVRCEVLAIELGRRMEWSWRGGPLDTVVVFELDAVADGGTRLRVTHSGFRGVKSRLVQWILAIGNRTLYGKRLPQLLDSLTTESRPDSCDQPSGDPRLGDPRPGVASQPEALPGPQACMSPWQRVLIAATDWIPGRRRKSVPPEHETQEQERRP